MDERGITVTFRIKKELLKELDKIASQRERSRSFVILDMIRDAIYLKQGSKSSPSKGVSK